MTTAINRRRTKARLARVTMFGLLAFAATLHTSVEARAQWATNGNNINNTNTGSVGVGTADPSQGGLVGSKFTVASPDDTSTAFATGNGTAPRFALNHRSNGSWTLYDYAGNAWNAGISQKSGNVGLGTLNPAARLHAAAPTGSTSASVIIAPDGTNTYYAGNTHDALFIDGSLTSPHGLYTTGALRLMRVKSADNADALLVGKYGDITATPKTNSLHHTLRLAPDASASYHMGHNHDILLINGTGLGNHGLYTGSTVRLMRLVNAAGGDALTVARDGNVTFGGNVDIGTALSAAKSTAKLNVGGDMNVTGTIMGGNITAKYQDVAEWVPSTQKLGAATVVVLDPARSNQVLASTSAYDTSVAGVISAQPGIALGERGEGKVLVATTGRVKVKVDATQGPIKVGDLLVTSEREGYAMKSEPLLMGGRKFHSPGTIVGKALEPLTGGTGEILVLLSLQ